MLSGKLGVTQAFLVRWYVCSDYMDVAENGSIYDCSNICLDQVSLACRRQHNKQDTKSLCFDVPTPS